ncbi:allantoate deiminase [Paenibacillus radicis (ex Xue et al. 2023)]|uniref:Allantoate deiminase n=1 Tax=Paenibacillus radicis (ex Xue et al. 2023) TaxID=2972489 RepID=A0ABT1YJF2_9BACL|nr:allantoate deiminase [Paenibacillus radicis (ex Xue et al. 2023)]MCR8633319.1 allantoate deiminase [Paenibacillus radicis (ex Xue et al. 2023)]
MEKSIHQAPSSKDELVRRFASEAASMLEWLAQFGGDPDGGVTRLLYSQVWQEAQSALQDHMLASGLSPYYDEAGNLFGRMEGSRAAAGAVLTGSHIDTVLSGGRYDGAYGIVAAVLAVKYLKEQYGQPLRTIEVVSFAEEEGSRFPLTFWGSGNVTGLFSTQTPPEVCDSEGVTLANAMYQAGFGLSHYQPGNRSDWAAFIELHIEQGNVLERERQSIGIVQGIVGQRRFTLEVTGESNHAGTTPMGYRRDALCGASEMIIAIRNEALNYGDPLVATVGKLEVVSGASNVVPGCVKFTLDVRHTSEMELNGFCTTVINKLQRIAESCGLTLSAQQWMDAAPILMNTELTDLLQSSCNSRNLSFKKMYSGAGHDAQLFAPICPTAMLFVPSHKGISHSPAEYTEPADLGAGIIVLLDLLYSLAYK